MAYISSTCQANPTILSDASAGRKDQESWFFADRPQTTPAIRDNHQDNQSYRSRSPHKPPPGCRGAGCGWFGIVTVAPLTAVAGGILYRLGTKQPAVQVADERPEWSCISQIERAL